MEYIDSENPQNEINLLKIFKILWAKKITILLITSLFSLFSIFIALSLPNIYTSKILLAPTESEESLNSSIGNFSPLTSLRLPGVNLPIDTSSKSVEAVERIKSFEFFSNYFLPNIKLENLMAVKSWIPQSNTIVYYNNLYDQEKNIWTRSADPSKNRPSAQEAFIVYREIMNIREIKKNFFVTISMEHHSPIIAKKWVEIVFNNINESMREADMINAQNSINFLNTSSKSTNVQSIRDVISRLLENQMQILMLASSNKSYVFKVLDSPIVPEKKSSPNRGIIVFLGTLLGGMFAILIVLYRYFREFSKADL